MVKAIIATSWDDGHPLDLKLAELLGRYDILANFCISIGDWLKALIYRLLGAMRAVSLLSKRR